MTLRDLLDDTIERLTLFDRVDILAVRKFMDGIDAQRALLQDRGLAEQLEPELALGAAGVRDPEFPCSEYDPAPGGPAHCEGDGHYLCGGCRHHMAASEEFAIDAHLTRLDGTPATLALAEVPRERDEDPYHELLVEYDHEGGAG